MEWTKSAKEELEAYLSRIPPDLQSSGADPAEVTEDIRRHIEEELAAKKLDVVTAEDLKQVLSKMGLPEGGNRQVPDQVYKTGRLYFSSGIMSDAFILIFGVIVPATTLCIELATHMCGGRFLDPVPTVWHSIMVGFVPLSNFLVWGAIKKNKFQHFKILGLLNAAAIGVSGFYTLLFLPILPFAAMAVLMLGWGLLPLSPLLSFICALSLRKKMLGAAQSSGQQQVYGLWRGIALGAGLLMLIEIPSAVTRAGLELAKSQSPGTSLTGVRLLRNIGNQEAMLRHCYERPGRATDLISFAFNLHDPVIPSEARTIFYRVYGVPFNSVPAPASANRRGWDFDEGQGEDAVAGAVKGLSLASSRLDASLDADGALAYTEWILEFQNKSKWQQEARAQIALPPDGFVSRLTLWINGEEREAAFAGRGKVREAYQKVVRRSRDPVLVTTSGLDRVLMQCFPVPANGGVMKVRIGITSPLILKDIKEGAYRLPYFIERNFAVPKDLTHSIWVEAKKPLKADNGSFVSEQPKKELFALRGALKDADVAKGENTILTARTPGIIRAWTTDPLSPGKQVVQQTLVETMSEAPGQIVIVIDGSKSLKEISPAIIQALRSIPAQIKPSLILATDEGPDSKYPVTIINADNSPKLEELLDNSKFIGGQDNVPALLKAWEEVSRREHGLIIWVHGPQPILMKPVEELKQRWDRRPDGPRLLEIQGAYGPNRILEQLDGVPYVGSAPRLGGIKDDLTALFAKSASPHKVWNPKRERIGRGSFSTGASSKETSSHLARLWAYGEVLKVLGSASKTKTGEAIKLAADYHLVTPVSGAVVLENREQYKEAGLEPADPAGVPTIPEPEVWLLLFVVALLFGWTLFKDRRRVRYQ